MTEQMTKSFSVGVEVKTVNHRYRDFNIKLPRRFSALEGKVRRLASEYISRGHIEITVRARSLDAAGESVALNVPIARGYVEALREIAEMGEGLFGKADPAQLLLLPDVVASEEGQADYDALWEEELRDVFAAAFEKLEASRAGEGAALKEDLLAKLVNIRSVTSKVAEIAPTLPASYMENLRRRIAELDSHMVDEGLLVTEMMLYADKCSIDEELTRLRAHFDNFEREVNSDGPVGRKLDFLLQEINREANTVASKAGHFNVSVYAAEIKNELEKLREQIQNIE